MTTENIEPVLTLLSDKAELGVRQRFQEILATKKFDPSNVQAGHNSVKAYVEYTHYAKRIYDAAAHTVVGHFPEAAGTPEAPQPHKE